MKQQQSKKENFTCLLIEKVIHYVTLIQELLKKDYNSCS